jgi:hypothetical protein
MSPRARRFAFAVLALPGALACTRNPYVIGSVCPPAGAGTSSDSRCGTPPPPGGTLVVDLKQSGASTLPPFVLASGAEIPLALRLRGESATATAWPSDGPESLARGAGTPTPGRPAPFTDATGAVGLPADAPAYAAADAGVGAVGTDDFVLEVVLRAAAGATVLDKRAGGAGWSLRETAIGQLALDLDDGVAANAVEITSDTTLAAGAWYHCLFWASHASGGRADCDGSEGTISSLAALGKLDGPAALAAGGGAAVDVALVALYRTAAGGLGDPARWLEVSARRFATLTGVYPSFAQGTALPAAGLRGSLAYLDLQRTAGGPRQLFLVGPDWPRVACRTSETGVRDCGYLAEPHRVRGVPADATSPTWQASGLTVAASATLFPDGQPRFAALAPSTAATTHALSGASTAGAQNQVFSFFVHRLTAARVAASGGAGGLAVFDLATGDVTQPPNARATMEAWGPDVYRCSYVLGNAAGPTTYAVRLVDDAGNETFAGAGTPTLEVGGLQVDDGLVLAGSLLAADPQLPDRLTFVADDGNLPTGASGAVHLGVLLPGGARVTDQAIVNLNRDAMFGDQVQLFVRGDMAGAGNVKFWRLVGGVTHWTFDGAAPVTDGARHLVTARWDASSAHLLVDDKATDMAAQAPNTDLLGLNRIDVGFSEAASGALEGLVFSLVIGAM